MRLKGRPLVPGSAVGRAVVTEYISFYGDVDVERGELRDGRSLTGSVVIARTGRGSTVGSYVIYALRKRHGAPSAVVMEKAEPIIVAGCVLADVPLVDGIPWTLLSRIPEGSLVTVKPDGTVEVDEAQGRP